MKIKWEVFKAFGCVWHVLSSQQILIVIRNAEKREVQTNGTAEKSQIPTRHPPPLAEVGYLRTMDLEHTPGPKPFPSKKKSNVHKGRP